MHDVFTIVGYYSSLNGKPLKHFPVQKSVVRYGIITANLDRSPPLKISGHRSINMCCKLYNHLSVMLLQSEILTVRH